METVGCSGQKRRSEQQDAESDGDGFAEKYLQTDDFVAKASMDELAKRWLVDGHGQADDQIAECTCAVDCFAGGGALDREAELSNSNS